MKIALHLGCSEFRSLRRQDQRLIARRIPAFYCVVEDSPSQRTLLEQTRIAFSVSSGHLIAIGDAAIQCSELLKYPLVPVLQDGQVPEDDPVGRQVCSMLIDAVLPQEIPTNSICSVSLPPVRRVNKSSQHLLSQILKLRGCNYETVSPSTALILGEMEQKQFTGVGIHLGTGAVRLSVSYQGQSLYEGTYHRGTRSAEESYARARYMYLYNHQGDRVYDAAAIQKGITNGEYQLSEPKTGDDQLLAQMYWQLMCDAWMTLLPDMLRMRTQFDSYPAFSVILGGPAAQYSGMVSLMVDSLSYARFPFKFHELFLAQMEPFSVCRGLLIHASLRSADVSPRAA